MPIQDDNQYLNFRGFEYFCRKLMVQISEKYATKDSVANIYRFKGSVDTVSDLPKNASAGDVWDVKARGINYAWTGEEWDALGELFAVDAITDSEIDALFQ